MLQNFIICVNAVIPSATYLIVGVLLRKFKVAKPDDVKKFTHLTFIALYPFLMFDNIYGRNIGQNMNWLLVGYCMGYLAVVILVTWLLVCRYEKNDYNRGAMIQAIFRSNIVLMGLPIGINLFGKSNVAAVAVVLLFAAPTYNVVSVIIFEKFRRGKADVRKMIKGVLTNPLIDGAIAALVVMALGIQVPEIIMQPVVALSDSTTPIAMVLLGASLNMEGMRNESRRVAVSVIGKLIIVPAFGIVGAVMLGFTGVELIAVVLMFATPTALASFAMASSMGGNGEIAGNAVVFSTMVSCFTLPIWLFALKTMGLF
ncbi:MAG: AEC family transporter [Clostridiales bacterium]|nr:AEC family transporter [Candidatus Crickella merdequi]